MCKHHEEEWYGDVYDVPTPLTQIIVEFQDITEDFDDEYLADNLVAYACYYNESYLGYIGFDYTNNFYTFYHQLDKQLKYNEHVLYNIADKLYDLNKERRLN